MLEALLAMKAFLANDALLAAVALLAICIDEFEYLDPHGLPRFAVEDPQSVIQPPYHGDYFPLPLLLPFRNSPSLFLYLLFLWKNLHLYAD